VGVLEVVLPMSGRVRGNSYSHEEKRQLRGYFLHQNRQSGRVRGKVGYLEVISKYILHSLTLKIQL